MSNGATKTTRPERPRPVIPRTGVETVLDVLAGVGVLVLVVMTAAAWSTLPGQVPTRFDAAGTAEEWGSKNSLLLLPLIGIALWVGLTILARYPHIYNYVRPITPENAERQYAMGRAFVTLLKAEMVWMFVGIQWMTISAARGHGVGPGAAAIVAGVVVMLGSTLVYIVRSYRAG